MRLLYSLLHIVAILSLIRPGVSVKEYLFKNCENSGFCNRNQFFANSVKQAGDTYQPKYAIDPLEVSLREHNDDFILTGEISKTLPNAAVVSLPFQISLIEGNNLRVTIDETRRFDNDELKHQLNSTLLTHRRYNETSNWAFKSADLPYVSKSSVEFTKNHDSIHVKYGSDLEYELELQFSPIKLTVSYLSEVQVVVNGQNFLNVEHRRPESANEEHLHVEESEFDMFQDSFQDSSSDTLPFGPESIGLDFTFEDFNHLYGIPEHADSLTLKDTTGTNWPYRLYNVDIFEYDTDSRMPMYGSIPFLLAVKPLVSVGLFWINSADTFVNIEKNAKSSSSHWISENGVLDFMIIIDKTPDLVNKHYGNITGYASLPQMFALGYHQSRWNYNDVKDVLEINSLMDKHHFPYDTIWLDIEYTESKKYFTWSPEYFPDPELMLQELDRTKRNLVVIVDPHFKTGYNVSDLFVEKKITINNPANETYYGHCWPGESVWIDTMNPNSQKYWDDLFQWGNKNYFMGKKSTNIHLWNDMNEPSVFNGPETTSPRDNIHYGGWEHRSIHNVFGMSYHEATYNSLMKRQSHSNRQRPFVLTRSYFAGSQRTSAMWTGDNMSKWSHLKASIPMVLTSNIAGMPFAGADVGGFFGNPSKELLTRWFQTGIWYPFFRAHAHIDSMRREPWVAGEPYTSIMRDAVQLRYSLLPVMYTSFREASVSGVPILKPVFYDNLDNLESYEIEDEFFLGNSGLLVKPVTDDGATSIEIYVPSTHVYYDLTNGEYTGKFVQVSSPQYISQSVGLADIPMYLRGGSIIGRKERYRRSTKLMYNDPYTLIIAMDANGGARGNLYVDDGESFGYTNGEYLEIDFVLVDGAELSATVKCKNVGFQQSLDRVMIEKIVLLSSNLATGGVVDVVVEQDGKRLEYQRSVEQWTNKMVITKPNLRLNSDWSISLEQRAGTRQVVNQEHGIYDFQSYFGVCYVQNFTILKEHYACRAFI